MRNRNWLIVGLAASVALNLALAGFLIGQLSRPGPVPSALDPSLGMFRMMRELPDERREAFRDTLRSHYRDLRSDLRRMRAAQHGINQALEREPFQPETLERALADFRAALLEGQQQNHRVLVKVAATLTPEEREALRETMARYRARHHRSGPDRRER